MRRLAFRAATAAVAGMACWTMAPAPPAPAAHTNPCSGTGSMATGSAFNNFVALSAPFVMDLPGPCAAPTKETARGGVSGSCFGLSGSGVTATGHLFSLTTVGAQMVFSGGVTGAAAWAPDPATSEDCNLILSPGADRFVLVGSVAVA